MKVSLEKAFEPKVIGSDEAIAKAVVELLNVEKAFQLSVLDEDEIKEIAYLYYLAKVIDSRLLEDFILHYLMLKVSKDGLGRSQITLIAARAGEFEPVKIKGTKSLIPI